MPGITVAMFRENYLGAYKEFQRANARAMEAAALIATHRGAEIAKNRIRQQMKSSGLGNLGQAIGSGSDMQRTGKVHRIAGDGWSASGVVFIRSQSERTRGAIQAYTEGANIRPTKGPWLWIPTNEIQRLVGSGKSRARLTPGLWKQYGLDSKIGPLVPIKGINGYPLLAVKRVGVSLAGLPGKARSLTKSGRARKGQVAKEIIIAFIGIPLTARAKRVGVTAIMRLVQAELPELFYQAFEGR